MKIILPILSILLLASCAPLAAPDLYAASAAGEATQQAAQARLHATEVARQERNAQATMSAAATRGAVTSEIQLLNARLAATREASELEYARRQATLAWVATQQAYQSTEQARPLAATLQAVSVMSTVASAGATQAALKRRIELDGYRTAMTPVLMLAVIIFLLTVSWLILSRMLAWQDRRRSLFQTSLGPVAWIDGRFYLMESLDRLDRYTAIHAQAYDAQPVEWLSPSVTVSAPAPVRNENPNALVLRLLSDAARNESDDPSSIPGWRHLPGWSSEKWQAAVKALESAGLVDVTQAGTTLTCHRAAVDLLRDLQVGGVRL